MIYSQIYDFCKIRDVNKTDFSNRAKFILFLLNQHNIEYKIVRAYSKMHQKYFYDIFAFGSSNKFLSCHYDVVNMASDNANDDSASIINAISYKILNPSINLIILDGEEPPYMGVGSKIASQYLKTNNISVKWILNLELTGVGRYFFIDKFKTSLASNIMENFKDEVFSVQTPFNDAYIFRGNGFQSNVLTTVNLDENGKPDMKILYVSHSLQDSVDNMSLEDMKYFTENTLDKIVKNS